MNSQKIAFAICAFLLFPLAIVSQSYSVSGYVMDEDKKAISYANIIAIKTLDSTTITGTTSDESGRFTLPELAIDTYLIKISFVGFNEYTKEIILNSDLDLGTITLGQEAQSLDEVKIISQRPTLKRENDRLVFSIENTSLTEGNVWDILKSTPGIIMINDVVSVRNASNIIYLINDKRVYLSGAELQQLLSGTTATAVKEIEVITNPPAKYDAEGGAVINIKMSKNLIAGYNGSIYGNVTQGYFPRSSAGTNHFFKGKKTSFYVGYGYNDEELNRINKEKINFRDGSQAIGTWETDVERNTSIRSHTANINFDYDINERNTFSISANGLLTPFWRRNTNAFTEAIDSSFTSVNRTDDDIFNIGANADYNYTSEKGSKFSLNFHHTNYEYDRFQDVNTIYKDISNLITLGENFFNTTSRQDIKIYSGQTDLSFPLKNDGSVGFGIKGSRIDSKSNILQLITNNGSEIIDAQNTGIFDYEENNYAAYFSLSKEWDDWSLSAGVRTEYTDAIGTLSNDPDPNAFDYFEVFPTTSIEHRFNDNHSLGISFSRRIERPTYSNLNPFKFFFNDNSFVSGNPDLKPAITELATLSYTLNDAFTFELYYRDEQSTFSELSFQDNDLNQIIYRPSNLNQVVDYGFDFILYKPLTRHWTAYMVTSIFHDEIEFFATQSDNSLQTNERWSFYGNAINYFTFLKDESLTANLSFLYISPYLEGSAEVSERTQVDIGLKKSFNKGKWVLSASANDIFLGSDYTVKNDYLDQDNQYYTRFDNRWVRIGLRYNFGNTKLSTNESIKELEERDRLKKTN